MLADINRLLLPSTDSATAEEIREKRKQNESAIAEMYAAQQKQRSCVDLFTQAQMALSQASPNEVDAVKTRIAERKAQLDAANTAYDDACRMQRDLAKKLDEMEAGCAQDELLMFIKTRFIEPKKKYARKPAGRKLGTPWLNWHTLRRTHATLLQHAGAILKETQAKLGLEDVNHPRNIHCASSKPSTPRQTFRLSIVGWRFRRDSLCCR